MSAEAPNIFRRGHFEDGTKLVTVHDAAEAPNIFRRGHFEDGTKLVTVHDAAEAPNIFRRGRPGAGATAPRATL